MLRGIQRPGPNLWGAGAGMEFLTTPSKEFRLLSFHWTGSIVWILECHCWPTHWLCNFGRNGEPLPLLRYESTTGLVDWRHRVALFESHIP